MKKLLLILLFCQGLFLHAHGFLMPKSCEGLKSEVSSELFLLKTNVNVILIPLDDARPGFESTYLIVYENLGRTNVAGEIELIFDTSKLEFETAVPLAQAFDGNTVRWHYSDLKPTERRTIIVDFSVFQPPIVENNDILYFYTSVTPIIGDEDPHNNIFELSQTVVNSFDPNDKRVLEGDEITIDKVGDYLHYIVRFQNIGNAPATNVRIHDELESKLNWSTFVRVSTSHNGTLEVNGNIIDFIFNDINLPPKDEDREGSKGFVVFKVKPIEGIHVGDVIRNRASIYFDFNEPIITNTAKITYVENLSIQDVNELNVQFYPNPVRNHLFLESIDEITSIEIFDAIGRIHQTLNLQMKSYLLDISYLKSGHYFIKISSNNKLRVISIVKK